jgi:hypothetical protein
LHEVALDFMVQKAVQYGQLPLFGVLLSCDTAGGVEAITVGVLPDWRSIRPSLERATRTAEAAVVVFPFHTRTVPRAPRVGLIAVSRGEAASCEAYEVCVSPLATGTVCVGNLGDVAPYLVPNLDGLFGEEARRG